MIFKGLKAIIITGCMLCLFSCSEEKNSSPITVANDSDTVIASDKDSANKDTSDTEVSPNDSNVVTNPSDSTKDSTDTPVDPDDTTVTNPKDTTDNTVTTTPVDITDEMIEGMVLVPSKGASFMMGLKDSVRQIDYTAIPQHKVSFTYGYYMDETEVTVAKMAEVYTYALEKGYLDVSQWRDVKNANGTQQLLVDIGDDARLFNYDGKAKSFVAQFSEKLPMNLVSWFGAAFYCNMLSEMNGLEKVYNITTWNDTDSDFINYSANGYRLPTEAEWEFACRAGSDDPYPWGLIGNWGSDYAYYGSSSQTPIEVKSRKPNTYGVYDMLGNVHELCNDVYRDWYYTQGEVEDPVGPSAEGDVYRIKRGGSSISDVLTIRAGVRSTLRMSSFYETVGFRVVLPLRN